MSTPVKSTLLFVVVLGLILASGFHRSPNVALGILNMGLISAIMAMGVNMQWGYAGLFLVVLLIVLWLAQMALNSPWGRMMRAIRDNEVAAEAMGKDVTARHLQIFVLGSAICGLAGAMMTSLDGLLTPGTYQPLRFTFLIWVMVIVGGSGNNFGAILGGFPDLVSLGRGGAFGPVYHGCCYVGDVGWLLVEGSSA